MSFYLYRGGPQTFVPGAPTLYSMIVHAGLTSGLHICLDAADPASYDGSSQTWTDRSGNSTDFFRGATSGSEATDPTFNGTSRVYTNGTYFSVDGGDYFRKAAANSTAINNLHKNNAAFTLLWFMRTPSSFAAAPGLFGTSAGATAKLGVDIIIQSDGTLQFGAERGVGGSGALLENSTLTLSTGTDYVLGLTVDEAATTGAWYYNGSTESFTSTYTSPSASNATHTAEIFAIGNGVLPMGSGGRLYGFAVWGGTALSTANIAAIDALWTRF